MPELGPKNLSLINKIRDNIKNTKRKHPNHSSLEDLVAYYDEEYIGSGAEAIVVRHKDKSGSGRLVAFNYLDKSPEEAKRIFYLHRFFSTLFPHNFPHFYASSGEDPNSKNKNVSGTIRHEILTKPLSPIKKVIRSTTGFSLTEYPFRKVIKICHELGIKISFDFNEVNFIIGVDGGEYYVDTLSNHYFSGWDIDKIVAYMERNKYTPEDINIVKQSVERLKTLKNTY